MSKQVEVIVTQARAGLKVSYSAGQRVSLPAHKAESAVANKWAKYAEQKTKVKAQVKEPAKPAAKELMPSLDTVANVLSHFGGSTYKMRQYAKDNDIYIHAATKKAETIAEKIAEANS